MMRIDVVFLPGLLALLFQDYSPSWVRLLVYSIFSITHFREWLELNLFYSRQDIGSESTCGGVDFALLAIMFPCLR